MAGACKVCDQPIPEARLRRHSPTCSDRCGNRARKRKERNQPEADPVPSAEERRKAKEKCTCNPHPIGAVDDGELRCFKCCGPLLWADDIREAHEATRAEASPDSAETCGQLLIKAQAVLGYDSWRSWLDKNFK